MSTSTLTGSNLWLWGRYVFRILMKIPRWSIFTVVAGDKQLKGQPKRGSVCRSGYYNYHVYNTRVQTWLHREIGSLDLTLKTH